MQTANVLLGLAGNRGETVPKYGVTAAEVAVLRLIHGEEAVYDIDIVGDVQRTHRQEIGRLTSIYGRQDGERRVSPAVNQLFPGAAARVFETFEELELPDELYVTQTRKTARPDPLDHDADGKKGGSLKTEARADKGLDGMTLNELRAHASRYQDLDLTGVSRKADVLEAIKLHESNMGKTPEEQEGAGDPEMGDGENADDEDGVGDMDDEFARTEANTGNSVFG